jgi:tRNA modification GTPase
VIAATSGRPRVVVRNKADLPGVWSEEEVGAGSLAVSAATGEGIDRLRHAIVETLTASEELRDPPAISNARHIALLETARVHVERVSEAAAAGIGTPEEFLLADLQQARAALEEITGRRTTEDLLRHIFERFCIGK